MDGVGEQKMRACADGQCPRNCGAHKLLVCSYEYTLPMSALFVPDRDYKPDLSPTKLKKHNAQNGILHNDSELISISGMASPANGTC